MMILLLHQLSQCSKMRRLKVLRALSGFSGFEVSVSGLQGILDCAEVFYCFSVARTYVPSYTFGSKYLEGA